MPITQYEKEVTQKTPLKICYVSAGRANLIEAHRWWTAGADDPSQVSLTFSGQVEEAASVLGAKLLMISDRGDNGFLQEADTEIRHLKKSEKSGLSFYWEDLRYCWKLLRCSKSFKSDIVIVDSGVTQIFMMFMFWMNRINVALILHNSLWPNGFAPKTLTRRIVSYLDGLFLRYGPRFILVVSPIIERQILEVAQTKCYPILPIRAQFHRSFFANIAKPIWSANDPFELMFVGRVTRDKGALDLVKIAALVEHSHPGRVRWTVCGDGPDLEALRDAVAAEGLASVFEVKGRVEPAALKLLYDKIHACIVPTRSEFSEGLAMTAIESVLAGRPLITNPVVPALEFVREAAIEVPTNDIAGYADAVVRLATEQSTYLRLQAATKDAAVQFYDRNQGLTAVLVSAIQNYRR
jgi:glycogen synthase